MLTIKYYVYAEAFRKEVSLAYLTLSQVGIGFLGYTVVFLVTGKKWLKLAIGDRSAEEKWLKIAKN
jgi:hypothetical protein